MKDLSLSWYVYNEDFNAKKIKEFNVFNHRSFRIEIIDLINNNSLSKKEFKEKVRSSLFYYFGFKCEYEIILSSFLHDKSETERKIDIYQQIMLNFEHFIDYLWSIRDDS